MSQSEYVVEVTAENIQSTVVAHAERVPVLLDFWAPWCEPCKALMPVLTKLAEEYQGKFILATVNVEEQPDLAAHFGAQSVPVVKIIKEQQLVDEFAGAISEKEIREILSRHIGDLIEQEAEVIPEISPNDDPEAFEATLKEQIVQSPDNLDAKIQLANFYLAQNRIEDIEALLETFAAEEQEDPQVKGLQNKMFFLIEAEKEKSEENDFSKIKDPAKLLALGASAVVKEETEAALQIFIQMVQFHREYQEDVGRKSLLKIFDDPNAEPGLVSVYRKKLFSLMH